MTPSTCLSQNINYMDSKSNDMGEFIMSKEKMINNTKTKTTGEQAEIHCDSSLTLWTANLALKCADKIKR